MDERKSVRYEKKYSDIDKNREIAEIIRSITTEFDVVMGRPERVKEACSSLLTLLNNPPTSVDLECLNKLIPLFPKRMGNIVTPLFDLFCSVTKKIKDPWPFLQGLLSVRDENLILKALNLTASLAQSGALAVDSRVLSFIADKIENDGSPMGSPKNITITAKIVNFFNAGASAGVKDIVTDIFLHQKNINLRRLAARILDLPGEPVSEDAALEALGEDAFQFFMPYLLFTRASFRDLLQIIPSPGELTPALNQLRSAESSQGKPVLKEIISRMGWHGVNYGIESSRLVSLKIGDSFPLMISPEEVMLFDSREDVRREDDICLFIGHGGFSRENRKKTGDNDPVILFKAYNLSHARIISDFAEIEPLTPEKVNRMLSAMDGIVSDYMTLFSSYSTESSILPDVYRKLKNKILSEAEREEFRNGTSPELSRHVLMFEDPPNLGAVQTLHGLKRYLHQKGLRLGFRLIDSSCEMNRTVSLITASEKKILNVISCISYINFDPGKEDADPTHIPYPVKIVVDAYARQMIRGEKDFPGIKIFCYGNEINYYISFRNHPAFLRIDFSHPLNNGMIDLEYYGVSKTEIDHHPNLSLDAIKYFFQYLGYDVDVNQTHIKVRYDKNRTMDTKDLYEKAEMLFNLVPYFMDIDWIISSLNLDKESCDLATGAWAGFFRKWGVLPLDQFLSSDRRGILVSRKPGPTGDQEVVWNGKEPYTDQTCSPLPEDLLSGLKTSLKKLGLDIHHFPGQASGWETGQLQIEKQILRPFREAVSLGGIVKGAGGLWQASSDLFQYEWAAERFAEILSGRTDIMTSSFAVAGLVRPLEHNTYFLDSGSINGYRIQYASIPVLGRIIGIYILRDEEDIIRLSFYTDGSILCRTREDTGMPWRSNSSVDAIKLANRLREGNCLMSGMDVIEETPEKVRSVCEKFRQINSKREHVPFKGERIIKGVKVSPGRVAGRILFNSQKRSPEDFKGKILVTPEIHPEDNALIYNCSGIVTTGGGILSHAALTALQFKKPSVIIHGKWEKTLDGKMKLLSYYSEYREDSKVCSGYKISARSILTRNNRYVKEGDIAVLDSEEGILSILGQERDAVKFHETYMHFCEATESLMASKDTRLILTLRGRRLRALHRLEKQLAGISDPFLACHIVYELLTSEYLSFNSGSRNERADLISVILKSKGAGEPAREHLLDTFLSLNLRQKALSDEIRRQFHSYVNIYERLYMRLKLLRIRRAVKEAYDSLHRCGITDINVDDSVNEDMDESFKTHFNRKLEALSGDVENSLFSGKNHHVRHLILQMERLDSLLGTSTVMKKPVKEAGEKILLNDESSLNRQKEKFILGSVDCGIELSPLTGFKAANLSEVERLEGEGLVPPWFVVTNHALNKVLDLPINRAMKNIEGTSSAGTLKEALKDILVRNDIDYTQKALKIMQVWDDIILPDELTREILAAYNRLKNTSCKVNSEEDIIDYVSIRSSASDEDTELSTNAGLFDTFLFIRGKEAVLKHLKRVWAGFWGERAIYQRSLTGSVSEMPMGGVIIQRLVTPRVSGVLQTVNVAEGNLKEMVINAGLGIGQGIVSGRVPGDQIFAVKDGRILEDPDQQIKIRYFTREKMTQAVFNKWEGRGVVYSNTPYHRRLRPALSYMEICNLVRRAGSLEMAYGYPLDIEFCMEGDRLWILQCRPVTSFMKILQETIKNYPLSH